MWTGFETEEREGQEQKKLGMQFSALPAHQTPCGAFENTADQIHLGDSSQIGLQYVLGNRNIFYSQEEIPCLEALVKNCIVLQTSWHFIFKAIESEKEFKMSSINHVFLSFFLKIIY